MPKNFRKKAIRRVPPKTPSQIFSVGKLFLRPNTSSSAREPTRAEYRMRNFHHISSANAAAGGEGIRSTKG